MVAVAGTQQILYPEDYLCQCADNFIVCKLDQYMTYFRYKIGSEPDINEVLLVDRIHKIICGYECGLCPDELDKLRERLNKIVLR